MRKKKEQIWNPMSEHPDPQTRVEIRYRGEVFGIIQRDGLWDGKQWLNRIPYTRGEFAPWPSHIELIGWRVLERDPYAK